MAAAKDDQIDAFNMSGHLGSLSYAEFHDWLLKNCLSETQLRQKHFPRPHPTVRGKAKVFNLPHKFMRTIPSPGVRLCRFCFMKYQVDSSGNEIGSNVCNHHPYSRPPPNKSYRCCGKPRMSTPCITRNFHVTSDIDPNNLNDFIYTKHLPKNGRSIYAIDCEFVHTKLGQELAAITIVDHNEDVVMDTYVRPANHIIDYLPQFSDLSEKNFSSSNCISNAEYRQKIRQILGPNDILIGHSLYGDLLRMNVIHDKVVDTSVLFPHPQGEIFMQSLRNLSEEYLGDVTFKGQPTKAYQDSIIALRLVKVAAAERRHR